MAKISEIKLPDNSVYQLKDNGALQLTGGTVTGPVNFEDSVYISDLNAGNLVVTGSANFINGINTPNVNGGRPIYSVIGTQTAATASWTGNLPVSALYDGLTIAYYLPRTSANNVTLNLTLADGTTTGAFPVYVTNNIRMTTHYSAGATIILTYWSAGSISVNGAATTQNRWLGGDYWTNTIGEYGGACIAGPKGMARYSLILQTSSNTWESLVTTSTDETNKTKNTSSFLITSPILYQNGNTYTSGQIAGYSGCWTTAQNVNSRYSFNVSDSWSAAGRPLYLVGTISGNLFTLKDTTWWADALPNTKDGYYYWYVGQMVSAYAYTLHPIHPIYYYDNGIKVLNINYVKTLGKFDTSITSLNEFIHEDYFIYTAAGGSNTVTNKPTGVDAFGVLSFKDAAGWQGQILMSSDQSPGIYWRTGSITTTNSVATISSNWYKVLDSNNYTDYTVTKTGTGATGTWGINITGNAATATTAEALTNKTLNSTTIHNTAGSFTFQGSGEPWSGTDWVGFQVGSNADKFQIRAINGTTLGYRQNDSGGTNTSWGAWYSLLSSGNYTDYTVTKTGGGASGSWGIDITGGANTSKYLMNRGSNTVSINDSTWGISIISQGHTIRDKVWHQQWKQSGLKFTPQGGSESNITDSADLVYYLSSSNTANLLTLNMAIDGIIYAGLGFKGVWNGNTISIAKGGTGLTASPSMLTNLASTTAASVFQANPRPGVTGTLGIANGGTGQTTAKNAINALLNGLDAWTADPVDNTYFIRQDAGGAASYGKAKFSTVWNYIKTKTNTSFNPGSLTIEMDTTDEKKALISFTAPSFS